MLVDDHAVVRIGLVVMLELDRGFKVVAQANDGIEALELFARQLPDVTLLDIRMPQLNGVETLRRILAKWPEARVIMLTTSDLDDDITQAIDAGARGYVLKRSSRDELIQAIRQVHGGETCIPEPLARRLAANRLTPQLTEREREVLALLPKGLTNTDIARVLGISMGTAKNHVQAIFKKLDVMDRSEAVTAALQRGILKLDE